ncbi:ATP-binding cassette sub-family A member 13 [Eupeodes corollae]|uniref:ATP-binding cassette sub-family A member 13 n=1 Tax=Eupeodes corollae TaxID=290404 RepID=UPI00249053FE|nr:ATP-binding cassette sub-family A member 13 [Eupeodes corollae]XP_055915612.1 ATP-binding cassette sub-family A member 13 [Eupeodes corollae]
MKTLKAAAFSGPQIKALLKKDVLVRMRQPWMTVVQFIWPCLIFLLLYTIRDRFGAVKVDNCQFPTRQLPTKDNVLPFFHSYICSIENRCTNTEDYEEYSKLEDAPMKPIIDIAQIFIKDDSLYNTLVDLPEKANFIAAVTSLVTNKNFNDIRNHIGKVIAAIPQVEQMLGYNFDIKRLFSDRSTFVRGGKLLCGHPFPSTDVIPIASDILYSEDFSEVNDDELDAMPTNYCKRLYLDVTSSNFGKLTWSQIKPIIHGKILYSPVTEDTKSIMKYSNTTFEELNRLVNLAMALDESLIKLRNNTEFQAKFDSILELAKSPIVKTLIGDSIDIAQIEAVMVGIRTDPIVFEVVHTIKNLLECFSIDRFVGVQTEDELQKLAFTMNKKRLYYAGVHFNKTEGKEVVYNFHMDTDNTPPTVEVKKRFWFPGPAGAMETDMKYHQGFVEIKHAIDMGIIKHKKHKWNLVRPTTARPSTTTQSLVQFYRVDENEDGSQDQDQDDDDDDDWFTNDESSETASNSSSGSGLISGFSSLLSGFLDGMNGVNRESNNDSFNSNEDEEEIAGETTLPPTTTVAGDVELDENNEDIDVTTIEPEDGLVRARRSPQGLLDLFLGMAASKLTGDVFEVENLQFFTKQFPYPAYTKDNFKTGLYLGQAIQFAFFIGLMAQIATCVRHRIWMRESRNTMIMRSMGLKTSSELVSWCITTFIEMLLIFIAVCIILYSGSILYYTKFYFVLIFLIIFGLCLISFCYMCATFFTSATVGSVTTSLFFLISFCPYILFIIYDAKLTTFENFFLNLSFTSAFAQAWNNILRMELQMTGLTFSDAFEDGLSGEFGFALATIIFDTILYAAIGYLIEFWTDDEYQFTDVTRDELAPNMGATMTNVSKIYGENNIAVSNISVGFQRDQVTCLLGRNGAGKSTIIKMLTGQIVQTTGRVILSQSSDKQAEEYDKIGVCSQDNILIPNLTAKEHLELYAKIKLKQGYQSIVSKTLKSMKFGKHENYPAWKLSGGYQRRLCVAIAFIGSPNVVILDEPCNGVDNKARKDIWDLIEALRKGRAVIFATHFLDEAEYLSDSILIMKNGKIIAHHNPETMKALFTENFDLEIHCPDVQSVTDVKKQLNESLTSFKIAQETPVDFKLEVSYDQQSNNCPQLMDDLESLQKSGKINEYSINSKNLEEVFTEVNSLSDKTNGYASKRQTLQPVELKKSGGFQELIRNEPLCAMEKVKLLFGKRFTHFSRNYRMLLCALILPAIFEMIAMWFVNLRLEDDFERALKLSKDLYPHTTNLLSMENPTEFTQNIYSLLQSECRDKGLDCMEFDNSTKAFYWILDTDNLFHEKRYGGTTFNETRATVWYNNKGHHSMISWLNDLNSHVLQAEMNDSDYKITAFNVPWKLGDREFSISSILRQVSDAGVSFVLLISLSLVMAVASVYIVNERMKGEKLQQMLCGVDAATYWGVAFVWDYLVLIVGIFICATVLLAFGMPVYTTKSNLWGICLLAFLYGFACIPAIHVVEKLFTDSSMAIMTIFCMNAIIPIFTMAVVVLIGIVGQSETADSWRFFLNRAFLIFPQHALGDGLLEICKNFVVAEFFRRYDIDSYKNPITSDLLVPHMSALVVLGIIFLTLNILIESGVANKLLKKLIEERIDDPVDDLKIISIQNSLKRSEKVGSLERHVLKVDRLTKRFNRRQYAVKDVSFEIASGECFGLLGKNGAGKSTIFKMLSGQMQPSGGSIVYANKDIAYCPQTNTLDSLLTVKEMINFYGKLRRINDIQKLTESTLLSFQLESYKDVLVKNLSGGNRRKLNVAITCFGWTDVVLMDEPTSDMDPVTRSIVYHAIDDLILEQRAIVLTSHSISEIDHICHRIAVLKDGQMLTCSRPETLKMQYGGYYSVAVFCGAGQVGDIEKKIHETFPSCTDIQTYAHSIKFVLKIQQTHHENDNSSLSPEDKTNPTLAELFRRMNFLISENTSIRFTINRCRLDTVFEKILDSSDIQGGYVHNGYVETETIT